MKFDDSIKKIYEGLGNGSFDRPGQGTGPNIDDRGLLPQGFKGANLPGIAPSSGTGILIKVNKKKVNQRTPEKKV